MKKGFLALCLMSAVFSAPACATVIDFESTGTPGTFNALNYAIDGFRFNMTMDNIDVSNSGWSGTGPAHSGSFSGLNNHGGYGELTRDGGGTFSFQSLWVKNWYDAARVRSGDVFGYLNGVEVGHVVGLSSDSWAEIVGNFAEIDTLRFNFGNFFLIDDIEVNNQPDPAEVPEPGGLALLGLGLAALFAGKKRHRR